MAKLRMKLMGRDADGNILFRPYGKQEHSSLHIGELYDMEVEPAKKTAEQNRHLWALINDIASMEGVTKDQAYQMLLVKADLSGKTETVPKEKLAEIQKDASATKIIEDNGAFVTVKIFTGASELDYMETEALISTAVGVQNMLQSELGSAAEMI